MSAQSLLEVNGLRVSFATPAGRALVLDGVSLSLSDGEVLGLLGESGCGKSTLIKALLGILPPHARIEGGEVRLDGTSLASLSPTQWRAAVRGSIGFVPQDPLLALNPVFRIGDQLGEVFRHLPGSAASHRARWLELLAQVQLADPQGVLKRYPHEFSGGQRQRLLIATALALQPRLIVADEPTTALDVTTQRQILELMRKLAASQGVAMLFVSHDLGVLAHLCHRVSVMYAGQSVEEASTVQVLHAPLHPYTRRLVACHPERAGRFVGIPGIVPSLAEIPAGCRFAPRCPLRVDRCSAESPSQRVPEPGRTVACPRFALTSQSAPLEAAADA